MKRRRVSESLTGGSGDVNPQVLIINTTQSANDTATISTQSLPIPRLQTRKGYQLVMEFLKVEFRHVNFPSTAASNRVVPYLTTNPSNHVGVEDILGDPRVLALWQRVQLFSSAAGFQANINNSLIVDLTDEAGHGLLVATDNVYLGIYSAGTGLANEFYAVVTYRFKEVSLTEYIGIVQSQQ